MTDALKQAAQQALEALTNSVDLVQADYDSSWKHGIPQRKAQLDAQLAELELHKAAIESLRAALSAPQPAAPQAVPVAWRVHPFAHGIGHEGIYAITTHTYQVEAWKRKGFTVEPLYTAPQPSPQPAAPAPAQSVPPTMPPAYMLAKLQMVMPLFQESRDALTAITEQQRKLHGISPTLAERMDEAGTFSLDDWQRVDGIKQPGSEAC